MTSKNRESNMALAEMEGGGKTENGGLLAVEEHPIVEIEENPPTNCQKFKRFLSTSRNWIGVIVARLMFFVLAMVCIGLAVSTMASTCKWIYVLFASGVLLIAEPIITLSFKGSREWKWATPCIYAYLLCTVPSIWIMEYKGYEKRIEHAENNITTALICAEHIGDGFQDVQLNSQADLGALASDATAAAEKLCLCFDCAPYMEQAMLFSLIIGRWILPKSKGISTDQKAQLLLVNIAVAADILEMYELMKEEKVNMDPFLIFIVLSVWTFSLLQFGLVSTATAERTKCCFSCFKTEMWALVTLLCMDDLSFLIIRLVFAIKYRIVSYSSLFFIAKNALVLILDINRIVALHNETRKKGKGGEEVRSRVSHIRR